MQKLTLAVAAALAACAAVQAGTVLLDSRAGLFTSGTGVMTMAIGTHPAWQADNPINPGDPADTSAIWISDSDSGYLGTHWQQTMGATPVVTVYETFASGAGRLLLKVWADDTASVYLDQKLLMPAVFTQNTCSGQAIGCRPQDAGVIDTAISAGNHTLSFALYQVGTGTTTVANPFGLLFTGTAPGTDPVVPEPAVWAMAGSGLAGLVWYRKRRNPRRQ